MSSFKSDASGFVTDSRVDRVLTPGTPLNLGYNWLDSITDQMRAQAIIREPVAHRIAVTVAYDVFDNWLNFIPTKEADTKDETFDQKIQEELAKLKAKTEFKRVKAFERAFGWGLLTGDFIDEAETAMEPLKNPTDIIGMRAYAPTQVTSWVTDKKQYLEDGKTPNLNYGKPEIYYIQVPNSTLRYKVHYTRAWLWSARQLNIYQSPNDWQGLSVLDPVWDDLTTLRNIAWSIGETMYRYAAPFADLTFTGAEKAKIQEWVNSGVLDNMYLRKFFAHNEMQTIDFKGVEGKALNPQYYYLPVMERISAGTSIPLAILRGIQVGAVTGSETDIKNYFDFVVSIEQTNSEDNIRSVVDKVAALKKIEFKDYKFDWNAPFELTESQKVDIELKKMQIVQLKQPFFTRNELRKTVDPKAKDLTPEQGKDDIIGRSNLASLPGAQSFNVKDNEDGSRTITELPRRRKSD